MSDLYIEVDSDRIHLMFESDQDWSELKSIEEDFNASNIPAKLLDSDPDPLRRFTAGDTITLAVPYFQAAMPMLGVVLGAWLKGRAGRKVRVKTKEIEVEAQTVEGLMTILDKVMKDPPDAG